MDSQILAKVDYGMDKLCRAYASERISLELFRTQRAALINCVLQSDFEFPNLILNEYAQDLAGHFVPETTPVLDDLGFQTTFDQPSSFLMPSRTVAKDWRKFQGFQETGGSDQHVTQDEFNQTTSSFDRYYRVYLGAFFAAIIVFVLFNL